MLLSLKNFATLLVNRIDQHVIGNDISGQFPCQAIKEPLKRTWMMIIEAGS